jgi:hypothetical protein
LNTDPVQDPKIKVLDHLDLELVVSDPDFDPYQDPGTDPVLEISDPGLELQVLDLGPDQEIKVSDPDPIPDPEL